MESHHKLNKIESIESSIRSYSYVANYINNEINKLENKQKASRKSLDKFIKDQKRQLKEAELNIAFLNNDLDMLVRSK